MRGINQFGVKLIAFEAFHGGDQLAWSNGPVGDPGQDRVALGMSPPDPLQVQSRPSSPPGAASTHTSLGCSYLSPSTTVPPPSAAPPPPALAACHHLHSGPSSSCRFLTTRVGLGLGLPALCSPQVRSQYDASCKEGTFESGCCPGLSQDRPPETGHAVTPSTGDTSSLNRKFRSHLLKPGK